MKRFRDYLPTNYAEKPSKGLYDAKAGDVIEVGMSGTRNKRELKIVKVLSSWKLEDKEGNIFNRDGTIYRGAEYWSRSAKKNGIKIYAVPLTKDKKEKSILQTGRDMLLSYIKEHKDELTKEQIQAIGKILNVTFSNLEEKI